MMSYLKKSLSGLVVGSVVTFLSTSVNAERLISVAFLSSNYQGCTGTCDKENIDCSSKDPKEYGSTQWCEKNCINRGKIDEYQFIQGVNFCRTQKTES